MMYAAPVSDASAAPIKSIFVFYGLPDIESSKYCVFHLCSVAFNACVIGNRLDWS